MAAWRTRSRSTPSSWSSRKTTPCGCAATPAYPPRPYGVVELTPEREYLLVTEFFADAVELGEAEVTDQVIDDGLRIIRKLWVAGLAHRDIKPANLLVRDGRLLLIDVAFVELRPTPWRQAVDLANMMLCLALRASPERVYRRALGQFTVEEITEGFAAARGLALPSQLRRMLRSQGRDVHAEFLRLLPPRPDPSRSNAGPCGGSGSWPLWCCCWCWYSSRVWVSRSPGPPRHQPGSAAWPAPSWSHQWLLAQSVPSASLVPSSSLPAGWMVGNVTVNNGRSVIPLNHDRAGTGVLVIGWRLTVTPRRRPKSPPTSRRCSATSGSTA